mgnify:CR=1 FL=1
MSNLIPRHDRVVVKPLAVEEKTQGGIYVPTKSDEKIVRATVVSTGEGRIVNGKVEPIALKAGQVVIFNAYSGVEVTEGDDKYTIIKDEDILAIVE